MEVGASSNLVALAGHGSLAWAMQDRKPQSILYRDTIDPCLCPSHLQLKNTVNPAGSKPTGVCTA